MLSLGFILIFRYIQYRGFCRGIKSDIFLFSLSVRISTKCPHLKKKINDICKNKTNQAITLLIQILVHLFFHHPFSYGIVFMQVFLYTYV